MNVRIIWSSRDWAEAVAALPAGGPLPCRAVLVPRERVAHVLRRELVRADRTDVLAGTRFVPLPYAAVEVLRAADVPFQPGEEWLRRARLMALFRSDIELKHFSRDLLREKPGWDEVFARTLADLEGAGLRPEDLQSATASDRLFDVAAIWRALDESAGRSWTVQRILLEASRVLEERPGFWPFQGPALVFAAGNMSVAAGRLLLHRRELTVEVEGDGLPFLTLVVDDERHAVRVQKLFEVGPQPVEGRCVARTPRRTRSRAASLPSKGQEKGNVSSDGSGQGRGAQNFEESWLLRLDSNQQPSG